ncbi:MAG: hypothetical protein KGL68_07225 [Burkholderiales bacterium]|nr:hypothetical protein [Burkholderiales bacterium]
MSRRRPGRQAALIMALAGTCAVAHAAGGHHAVDDATILEPGQCEQESWVSGYRGGGQLLHAGANCRVGPVEFNGAGEHARGDGASATQWNLEMKWARPVTEGFAVGLDLMPVWAARQHPRYAATRLNALATWNVTDSLDLHFNAGHDWLRGDRDLPRGGIAAEWAPVERWSFVAERYLDTQTHYARAGARFAPGPGWSVDTSYAQRLSGPLPSYWTVGLTIALDRK